MECGFCNTRKEDSDIINIESEEVPERDHFLFRGSIVYKEGDIEKDDRNKIPADWLKWRSNSGVLCDCRILFRLKENIL